MKPKDYPAHLRPRDGEALPDSEVGSDDRFRFPFGAYVEGLPTKVARIVATHVMNRNPPIVPDDGGAFPEDCVACVRDRAGLIAYAEDGAGRRLEADSLAAFGSPKRAKKKAAKKRAGRRESAPSPDATDPAPEPPPPPQGDAGSP